MIAKVLIQLAGSRLLPVLPQACDAKWRAILHSDSIRLLGPLPLDSLPLEKTINRHDTAAHAVRVPKRRQVSHRFALSVDRLAPARGVFAPIGNEAPAQRVERHFTGLVISSDHQQVLARRGIPSGWIVVNAAIAHVYAINDGIPKRTAALDDPPAHARVCRSPILGVNLLGHAPTCCLSSMGLKSD